MIRHSDLGVDPKQRQNNVRMLIAAGKIRLGGNKILKIYGTLSCASGKRMRLENRVFFETEEEAVGSGYHPCGHCMREEYKDWKAKRA